VIDAAANIGITLRMSATRLAASTGALDSHKRNVYAVLNDSVLR
jgi:hypothetical protein